MGYRKKSVEYYNKIILKAYNLSPDQFITIRCKDKKDVRRMYYHIISERLMVEKTGEIRGRKLRFNQIFKDGKSEIRITCIDADRSITVTKGDVVSDYDSNVTSDVLNMIKDGLAVEEMEGILDRKLTVSELKLCEEKQHA